MKEWKSSTADQARYQETKISCLNAIFAYVLAQEKLEKREKKRGFCRASRTKRGKGGRKMPRLKMPERQQAIYDELVDSAGGAKMLALRDIANFWGRDDRAARKWVQEKQISAFVLNGIKRYSARDVAKAIYFSEA